MTLERNVAPERYLFGPYEILDTLGRGGMGVVYRAQDRTLGREVALKILRDDLRAEERVLARFRREAEAFARLDHRNIVHVFSVGAVENIPFIAMQYIHGETLADRLRRSGPISWQETLKIGREVSEALACAHEAQVIHRDIKPGNILLAEDGRVLVTDFGIAKVLNATTQLTLDGSRLGTPQYMCPERCQNKPVTPSSDLYSLGVVLFQCITGKLPYAARSNVELIDRITGEDAMRASSLLPELPESVDRLLAWLLEKNPARRPADAATLCTLIDRVLEGKPLDAEADQRDRVLDGYRMGLTNKPARAKRESTENRRTVEHKGWWTRVARVWFATPVWIRVASLAVASGCFFGMVGYAAFKVISKPVVSLQQLKPAEALARWDAPAPLVGFAQERMGVSLVDLNALSLKLQTLSPTAQSGEFVLGVSNMISERPGMGVMLLQPEVQSARSVLPPDGQLATMRPLAFYATRLGEQFLFASESETRMTYAAQHPQPSDGLPGVPAYTVPASAASLPYPRGDATEIALAITRGGFHDWQLQAHGASSLGNDARLSPAGPPIKAVAAAQDGSWFTLVRETAEGGAELWMNMRGAEARLIDEGVLSLTQRAIEPGASRVVYQRGSDEANVVVRDSLRQQADITWPGAVPQWSPRGGVVFYLANDALQHRQLFLVDPSRPLETRQLTHLDLGVGDTFAIDAAGKWALVNLVDTTQALLLELDVLLANV